MRLHIHYSPVWNTSNWMTFFRTCRTTSSFKGHMSTLLPRQRWFIHPKGCRDHSWRFFKQEFIKWSQLTSNSNFITEQEARSWFLLWIKAFSSLSSACYFPPTVFMHNYCVYAVEKGPPNPWFDVLSYLNWYRVALTRASQFIDILSLSWCEYAQYE